MVVRVANDVSDSSGAVVIPAGAEITLTIREIAPAANKGEKGTIPGAIGVVAAGNQVTLELTGNFER